MLSTLQAEIQVMYDLDFDERIQMTPRERSIQMITQYLSSHGLDNPRMNIKSALGLLAFAEQDGIRWRQGYIENFVHLAGFLNSQIEESPDFKRLSMGTRRNLTIGAKGIQLQVLEAEEKLSSFDLDMWEETAKTNGNPVYQSYNAFRQFLITHYTKTYGSWPPNHANRDWLNRKVILALQEDFGSLYDYLVNRDVVWDSREERPGKKWMMQHQKNSEDFRADFPELELTDMLVTFDTRHGFEHIPHPYPLLPREVRTSSGEKQTKRKLFGLKKSKGESTRDAKAHLQLSIVFGDATNIERLEASFGGFTLIDAFERFELATDVHRTTPRDARLGRWILLYGILQVLSRLSVDVAGLRFKENVPYFLCADMKRCPEWVTNGHVETIEASQQRSYCWTRSWSTKRTKSEAVELEASSIPLGGELEGVTNLTMLDGTTMQSPIAPLDGPTMLNNDIQRISEKIDELGRIRVHERRIENEKMKREDVVKFPQRNDFRRDDGLQRNNSFCTNDSFRLTESEYQRPLVPVRNPLRSNAGPQGYGSRLEQYPDEKGEWTLG
ncbi:hypothetical protein GQ43DRAFT_412242 [Delitschia confertaspora ATCC 74209]|uniref:DUF8004 domain-containing protein n=1 Tax=Delitschia confertaspora ATCC 74209 TaxID=1513339 RepID=A0A9P4JQ60_9PLEO|nr:hypothetical protein GQ43DRAFT_412242 [Delitschia confertaspora ATCC 74209]